MASKNRTADLTIAGRFCGPARSGNGGYTAGSLAERVHGNTVRPAVEVRLRQPPPLDVAMNVERVDEGALLLFGGSRIAEARVVNVDLEPVEAVSIEAAREAATRFIGLSAHPFPRCFACGPDRAEGDGLRIFPGPMGHAADDAVEVAVDGNHVASGWVPHPGLAESSDLRDGLQRVGLGVAWAALDCVGGWAGGIGERRMVLGAMTAQVDDLPLVDEPHVVVGTSRGSEGRKTFTASTLYDSDGRIVGRASHTWIAIDPSAFI